MKIIQEYVVDEFRISSSENLFSTGCGYLVLFLFDYCPHEDFHINVFL